MDVIYLDYDGVLHPSDVYAYPDVPIIRLEAPGHELFENVAVLELILAPFPHVVVVLSTTWCLHHGVPFAMEQLTPAIRTRVIGTTFDSDNPHLWRMPKMSRWDQISCDVERRKPRRWLALDDDGFAWPERERDKLVLTPADLGLQCVKAQNELKTRMAAIFA